LKNQSVLTSIRSEFRKFKAKRLFIFFKFVHIHIIGRLLVLLK